MDLTYKQEVGVGGLVLAGLAVFVLGMFWLTGRSFSGKGFNARVAFTNVAGLKVGDPVMVSGVHRGRVLAVTLDRVGHVTVTLQLVDPADRPKMDATATVAAGDFFGGRFIDYFPGSDTAQFLPSNGLIQGTREEQLTDVAEGVATKANALMTSATNLVNDRLATDIHNTLISTQRAMDVVSKAGSGPLLMQATATLASAEKLMNHLDSVFAGPAGKRVDTLTANLASLSTQLNKATTSLSAIMTQMQQGKGTLGKMATDSSLYFHLDSTLVSLNALLKDLRERPGRYLTVKVF
ncbi:MAG TPA: MlaD family protein [Gemmatimonadales bacterium]|nr:MlaD family protein [Gemmatimonadales bacterium]